MVTFAVSEAKNIWLQEKMNEIGLTEKDLEEKFIRSAGSGGQKVNKTASCVYLKHIPSGIEVKCMKERSQSINRFLARRELVQKLESLSGKVTTRDLKIEKTRKQKTRRRRRSGKKANQGR